MKKRTALLAMAFVLAAFAAMGETATFPGGTLEAFWVDDAELLIRVALDVVAPQTSSAPPMWVLTVNALRIGDGIHSWQLHWSATYASVVVIPNDFLVVRHFALEQLEIDASASESGKLLSLLVPRSGPIPELIAPGDVLEVYALWLQQLPLASVRVPEWTTASGAGGELDSPSSGAVFYVPTQTVFTQGTSLSHVFTLVSAETDAPTDCGSARIALVRIREGLADELVAYLYREPETGTGLVSYEFDTSNLAPGKYDLIVWANPPGIAVRQRIELVPSES